MTTDSRMPRWTPVPPPNPALWRDGCLPAIDLFAGCGGTSLGLRDAGLDLRAAIEIDEDAAASYRLNLGFSPIIDNIGHVTATRLRKAADIGPGECFLLAACPPCQGFSSQRRLEKDEKERRNRLLLQVARIVHEMQPAYLLLENVPGLLKPGPALDLWNLFTARLRLLGYVPTQAVLDAADYGVPQRRKRLLCIARHHTAPVVDLPTPTHRNLIGAPPLEEDRLQQWRTVRDQIGSLPQLAAGEGSKDDPLHRAPSHSAEILERIRAVKEPGSSRASLPEHLRLRCHHEHHGHTDVYGRMWWDRPAPTITGGCNKPSKGRFIHPDQDRAITLREAALLQAFPADAQFKGTNDGIAAQIGNAVPPLLVKKLARPIVEAGLRWVADFESGARPTLAS
jgi:DNA (cytosine-5)-methyltransferase 1